MTRNDLRPPLPVVVLISGNGSNLQAMIDGMRSGDLPIEIRAVFCNRPDVYGLERARQAGIPAIVVDHKAYPDRRAFDEALAARIDEFEPGLIVLAGFMRILTPEFVGHYAGRMLNIHPSLLPEFTGLNTHQRALDVGRKEHGVSVHFVTADLDGGPVIARSRVEITSDDDADSLARKVQIKEHRLYPAVVAMYAKGRLELRRSSVFLDGDPLVKPVDIE
ncbi:MAG: phosphoribosylglycinamide formyltransferase [Gammaproteobacteria bacterium]|nr:phosphoribosylglycinamide formyltransferase [Gammaproteobacteria bacterium]